MPTDREADAAYNWTSEPERAALPCLNVVEPRSATAAHFDRDSHIHITTRRGDEFMKAPTPEELRAAFCAYWAVEIASAPAAELARLAGEAGTENARCIAEWACEELERRAALPVTRAMLMAEAR